MPFFKQYDEDINRVKGILNTNFSKPEDRQYWENKLTDLQNRKASAQEYYNSLSSQDKKYYKSYISKYTQAK